MGRMFGLPFGMSAAIQTDSPNASTVTELRQSPVGSAFS